mmetsp:Transcript_9808/g.19311  ORF Transcript_9808/g.19311 Transcript_9808/m.19311 type:complete len:428 (-) Transcript_9808:126-1409(-)
MNISQPLANTCFDRPLATVLRRHRGLAAALVFVVAYATLSWDPVGDNNNVHIFEDHQEFSSSNVVKSQRFLREQESTKKDKEVEKVENDSSLDDPDSKDETSADELEQNHQRAIALISFGESAANSTLVERAVLSIRRRGAFNGPVMVLTDAPEERYEGVFDKHVTVVNSKDGDLKFGYFENEGMKYKRFKTLILDYLDMVPELDSVKFVYYMDIDMLMGAPFYDLIDGLNTDYGIETSETDKETSVSKLFFFRDPNSQTFYVNSGFMILHRHNSRRCLELWRKEMDSHPRYRFDQQSLNLVVELDKDDEEGVNPSDIDAHVDADAGAGSECHVVPMQSASYLVYTSNQDSMINLGSKTNLPHLIHIYNSCKAQKFSEEATEKFVSLVLNLTEEEQESHKFGKAVITPSKDKWMDHEAEDSISIESE